MIDKRVGKRIKQRREELGLTQEAFAEKLGVATNYISTIERGASFPRYEKLVMILNGLQTSADSIFCDVLDYSFEHRATELSAQLESLPPDEQKRILGMVELMIKQAKENNL
ncbi:MAG: helix-turn-helix domain-containing protein [Oscillospiraceae bacterium]|nr:helix-turn-helix domain-containing protein [Oscillospiraceae bacterium]